MGCCTEVAGRFDDLLLIFPQQVLEKRETTLERRRAMAVDLNSAQRSSSEILVVGCQVLFSLLPSRTQLK
jgi:hypothetical protein